jgi:hypothetical protein
MTSKLTRISVFCKFMLRSFWMKASVVLARTGGHMDHGVKEAIEIWLHLTTSVETWNSFWVDPGTQLSTYSDKIGPLSNNGGRDLLHPFVSKTRHFPLTNSSVFCRSCDQNGGCFPCVNSTGNTNLLVTDRMFANFVHPNDKDQSFYWWWTERESRCRVDAPHSM